MLGCSERMLLSFLENLNLKKKNLSNEIFCKKKKIFQMKHILALTFTWGYETV